MQIRHFTPGNSRRGVRPLITVRGEASAEAEPELAEITVVVRPDGGNPDQTLRRIGTGDVWCTEAGLGGATVTQTITVGDFTVLGDLIARLADQDLVELRGPRWLLRPESGVRRQVRQAAVRDAVGRAREYAEVLGCELIGLAELTELTDPGLTTTAASWRPQLDVDALAEEMMLQVGTVLPPAWTLPERQLVRARVQARFTTTAPDACEHRSGGGRIPVTARTWWRSSSQRPAARGS